MNFSAADMVLQLIRIALCNAEKLSKKLSDSDWDEVYSYACKQAVTGICFAGIQRLPKEQIPYKHLLMKWFGQTEHIRIMNSRVDQQTAKVWSILYDAGFNAAILKGQGIATLYGELSTYRTTGDIDVWVSGGFDVVNKFVQETIPTKDLAYHRFHYGMFQDTEVELHFRPTLMRNLLDDVRLQKWCKSFEQETFVMTDKGFMMPPLTFNRVFILTHIYRHFLFEGIGMRQLIDYYFVLKSEVLDAKAKTELMSLFKSFRLTRFVQAIMWIMQSAFGLEDNYLLCTPNVKEGQFVLSEVLQTGNFGHNETRYQGFSTFNRMSVHGLHLISHYPSEVLWTPVWLLYHKIWKFNKLRKTKKI